MKKITEETPEVKKPSVLKNIVNSIAKALRISGKTVGYPIATIGEGAVFTGISTSAVAVASAVNVVVLPLVTMAVGLKTTALTVVSNTKSAIKDGKYQSISMVAIQNVKALMKKDAPKASIPIKKTFIQSLIGIFAKKNTPKTEGFEPVELTIEERMALESQHMNGFQPS